MNAPTVENLLLEVRSAMANLNSKFDDTAARHATLIEQLFSENRRLSSEMARIQDILKSLQGSTTGLAMEIDTAPPATGSLPPRGSAASKYSTNKKVSTPIIAPTSKPATTTTTTDTTTTATAAKDNTWVNVVSKTNKRKPKAPISERKRSATARAFTAPATPGTPSGYDYVYLHRSRNINRKDVRHKFSLLGVETARVLDISFPARSVIGVLLHQEYKPVFLQILTDCKITTIEAFDPLDPIHVADPKYSDMPVPQRARLASALHQDRCYNTLNFVREYLVPSVAKFFVEKQWISDALATSVIQHRLPRTQKKSRLDSYRGFATEAFLTAAGDNDMEMGEEFHENAYDSDNSTDSDTDKEIEVSTEQLPHIPQSQ